ncbi:MAG: HAMP domain-containing histidine kinase [Candidatus Dormibacteraeota bacterium]|nr:HAMP domain-containing histidine kinase [Candidatus Dormibacteraeota bacterium]
MRAPPWTTQLVGWVVAMAGPLVLTAGLVRLGNGQRQYVFLYLALVAVLGVLRGLWPAVVAAAVSFLLVDYYFVEPPYTLAITSELDIVNLLAFVATSVGVGLLGSLARQQQQIRALRELDRARRELLANVSHELRTPLGTILTLSTASPVEAGGRAEADPRLAGIAGEARRLRALVDDMLDLAVIEAGTLELRLEPLRLADAIEAAVEQLQRTSPGRSVEWPRAAAGEDVLADWDRLLQVLDNLLANADRFGPAGTAIEVGIGQDGPRLVAVTVRDHGPGVAPEVRPRLFERFVHAPADDSRPAGTGLGLAIVKGLVEAQGGSVSLVERGGEGASFRFTVPLAEGGA